MTSSRSRALFSSGWVSRPYIDVIGYTELDRYGVEPFFQRVQSRRPAALTGGGPSHALTSFLVNIPEPVDLHLPPKVPDKRGC
ncbi:MULTISPECIES: hypothetical protein [unclassified Streptomyces]|uniref:hypothetical protein n=1 Tax=unclassified Streptomyces TaxID=2593676 RepID=UPI002DD8E793|nr:hypothetical protein [Streptomyces sp. NBC_01445]WSE02206.1 hypothetical protein OG574_01505 [Streptomyces sp. NBC_01445]